MIFLSSRLFTWMMIKITIMIIMIIMLTVMTRINL